MTLKADLAAAAVAALQDIRCSAVRLCVEDIIKRRVFGGGVPEYRIYVKGTDTPILNFDDLISHIVESNVSITYDIGFVGNNYKDKCKPVTVIINNVEVRFMSNVEDDSYFTTRYGLTATTLAITLNYVSDNDTVLPLKAIECSVISARSLN